MNERENERTKFERMNETSFSMKLTSALGQRMSVNERKCRLDTNERTNEWRVQVLLSNLSVQLGEIGDSLLGGGPVQFLENYSEP